MKIKNGSPKLFSKKVCEITLNGDGEDTIAFGEDRQANAFIGMFVLVMVIPLLRFMFTNDTWGLATGEPSFWYTVPGPWYYYLIIAISLGVFFYLSTPDDRLHYTRDKIALLQVMGHDRVSNKKMGSSLGGAAVGGIIFGGAGAVVGSIASGNKITEYSDIILKFTDGEWIAISTEDGFLGSMEYNNLLKLAGEKNQCPI